MALGDFLGGGIGGAFVELVLNDTGFNRGLVKADAKLQAFGNTAGKTTSTVSGFSKVANVAYLAAGTAAVAFAIKSIKAFEDHQAVLVELQHQISKTPGLTAAATAAFQAQAEVLQNLTGYERDQILAADTVLLRFKLTGEQVQKALPILLDYARATGKDVPEAANLVGRALLGNARALKMVGIQFKATGDTTKDFNTIVAALNTKVGGTAKAFGTTLPGEMAKFHATLTEVEQEVGKQLAPVLTELVKDLGQLLIAAGPILRFAAKELAKNLQVLALVIGFAVRGVTALVGWFQRLAKAGGPVGTVIKIIAKTVQLAVQPFALLTTAVNFLAAAFRQLDAWASKAGYDIGKIVGQKVKAGQIKIPGIPGYGGQYGFEGTVRRPTLFLAGEGNQPEDVSIRPRSWGAGSGGGNTYITLVAPNYLGTPHELLAVFKRELVLERRRGGVTLTGAI